MADQARHDYPQQSRPSGHPLDGADTLREPLNAVLLRLRTTIQAQIEAVSADAFDDLDGLSEERDRLVAHLTAYGPGDAQPLDQPLLHQVGALDEQLRAVTAASLEQTRIELRDLRRGRGALNGYRRRNADPALGLSQHDFGR
jgi:hypothetical protein